MGKVLIIVLILALDLYLADPLPFIDEAGLSILLINSISEMRRSGG